ncbi:acyl-CoA thioesterase/BAAT N-terminal domain-containing protein [Spirillospora sp. NPDC127200]
MRCRLWMMLAALAAAGVVGGCGNGHSDTAVITVDQRVALADRPVQIRITGLKARDEITVTASAQDRQNKSWSGRATFRADAQGVVDLARARPVRGTYAEADAMGLLWSMTPADGDPEQSMFIPADPNTRPAYAVRLEVAAGGRVLARQTLERRWLADGVTRKSFTVAADKIAGELFLPPASAGRRTAVLLFGGSEGGNTGRRDAALLASHGHPTLSLAYFGAPGLPSTLRDIPLEYFARAARTLAAQPGVDSKRIVVWGYSRGTEPALLLAQRHPDLIASAVLYAPSGRVILGFPSGAAWTRNGEPVAVADIPLDRVDGPVLAIAGAQDRLWPSAAQTEQIMTRLNRNRPRLAHRALTYPDAGHGVGTYPYTAAGTRIRHPVTGTVLELGGTRAADAAARAQSWPQVLNHLAAIR